MNKEEFIDFAKNFNVFMTLEEPNYLECKEKILSLLNKFQLSINDIQPNPRSIVYKQSTSLINR